MRLPKRRTRPSPEPLFVSGFAAIQAMTEEQVAEESAALERRFAEIPPWSGLTVRCRGCTVVADPENTTAWAEAVEGCRAGMSVWPGRGLRVFWVNRRCRVCSYKWKERRPVDIRELCMHEGHVWPDRGWQSCRRCHWTPEGDDAA